MKSSLVRFGKLLLLLVLVCITFVSCDAIEELLTLTPLNDAVAIIGAASGSDLTGMAMFMQEGDTITVFIEIAGASPGLHAVHIHEIGDCSAADGTSAGGHWNPTDAPHGKWGDGAFHLGDLGNIEVGQDGIGTFELTTNLWEMGTGSDLDIVGKGIIVHAGADDFTSQPSGNAGARIGCGAIELIE